ncbi:MAG: phosphatidylcholine/phosphatidylserine synthase [Actinomycetota bacterium]|nr:phosphatidylcholine/phosphatidylserine synthase [Actinomycetota bacterium]MDQ4011950.1 phosphatidylcholine/phosphatidylserine synthase [Actinomycetota bacterium]
MPGAGVRLLPNAITVLALCSGLSAVKFALDGNYAAAIAAISLAALLDALDGRLARLLDATSRIGAELDSLADGISFGVAPAVVLFIWALGDIRAGWSVALMFTVCVVLRLARFNTLLDDTEAPPFAKEFFVGVPSPSGALLALLPLTVFLQFGAGWWSSPVTVAAWTIVVAVAMVSRLPTQSVKAIRVPARAVAPLLVLIAGLAAAVITFPFASLSLATLLYVAHIPYASYRYRWLAQHPSAWEVPPGQRRAIRRTARSMRRLGLRPPLRRRVAGAAARAGAAVRRRRNGDRNGEVSRDGRTRRIGLRRRP